MSLEWKLMSCSYVKSWFNLLTWLLIGCLLLCSQSGASLLVDTTLAYNPKVSAPGRRRGVPVIAVQHVHRALVALQKPQLVTGVAFKLGKRERDQWGI